MDDPKFQVGDNIIIYDCPFYQNHTVKRLADGGTCIYVDVKGLNGDTSERIVFADKRRTFYDNPSGIAALVAEMEEDASYLNYKIEKLNRLLEED